MKHVQKRLLSAVVAMMLVCSVLPVNMLAAEEEAAAEPAAEAVVETTTPEPQEPTAVIDNNDLADSVVSTPAEEPVTEEPTVEEPMVEESSEEVAEPTEEVAEETEPEEEATEPSEEQEAESQEPTETEEVSIPTSEEKQPKVDSVSSKTVTTVMEEETTVGGVVQKALEETTDVSVNIPVLVLDGTEGNDKTINLDPEKFSSIQDAIDWISEQEDKEGYTIVVPSGTYGRFTVLNGLNGLTVTAAEGAEVIINVCDNSTAPATTSGAYPDTAGVSIRQANNVTIQNLKFQLGIQKSPWTSAAISNYTESGIKGDNFTVDGCTFLGYMDSDGNPASNIGVFVNTGTTQFTVTNCTFKNMKEAISMYGDKTVMKEATVSGNTFTNNSFAIHGYYGGTPTDENPAGTLSFTNNTVTGTDTLRSKIVIQDQTNTGALKADVKGNTFENALVGLVNLRELGETVSDVLKSNTMGKGSFYVEAMEPGTIEFYTTYIAPENGNGYWELTGKEDFDVDWGKNPDGSTAYIEEIVKAANESGDKKLVITGIDAENLIKTFTWFKDGIYWVTDPDTPDEPDKPTTPDEPDKPTTPDEPDKPTTPTPTEPTTPAAPVEPEPTVNPEQPTEPTPVVNPIEEPTEPDVEEPIDEEPTEDPVDEEPTTEPEQTETNNDSGLPQTGQDWMMVSVLLIAGVAILVVGFNMKRRKVED